MRASFLFDDLTGRGKAQHLLFGPVCLVIAIRSLLIADWTRFVIAAVVASCEEFMFFLPLIVEGPAEGAETRAGGAPLDVEVAAPPSAPNPLTGSPGVDRIRYRSKGSGDVAWGKSEQEKAAERQQELQARQEQRRQEERAEYLASPVGMAEQAKQRGDTFFQLQIDVSQLTGVPSVFGSSSNQIQSACHSDVLGQIEALGWRLEHVGYVFIETGATTTNRMLSTGQGVVTEGLVQGLYLFRAVA